MANTLKGSGTSGDPYLIEDAHDLLEIKNHIDLLKRRYFKIVNDINMNVAPFNEGEGFPGINIRSNTGGITLDGGGHKIIGLYMNNPEKDHVSFVGNSAVKTCVYSDLHFIDAYISGKDYIGVLCGTVNGEISYPVTVKRISLENCTTIGNKYVGALTGYSQGKEQSVNNIKIKNCSASLRSGEETGLLFGSTKAGSYGWVFNAYNCIVLGGELTDFKTMSPFSKDKAIVNLKTSLYDKDFFTEQYSFPNGAPNALSNEELRNKEMTQSIMSPESPITINGETIDVWSYKNNKFPELWFEAIPTKYLIQTAKGIEDLKGNILESLDFENYGFLISDLSNLFLQKKDIIKIFSDQEVSLRLVGDKILDGEIITNNIVNPQIYYTGVPKGQLVLPKDDIKLKMLHKIKELTLYSNSSNLGLIRIIFSTDSGKTWNIINNDEVIEISLDDAKTLGMTADEFNSINEKWSSIIIEDKIRFAYYLEIESEEDIAEIDELVLKFDMIGKWNKVKEEDYNYGYDNNHLYITFYKDGSYKINYQE